MAAGRKSSRSEQTSIKYTWVPLEVSSSDLSDIGQKKKKDVSKPTEPCEQSPNPPQPKPKSPEILSTSKLMSAVGRVWDSTFRPLPPSQPKPNLEQQETLEENISVCLKSDEVDADSECIGIMPKLSKIFVFESCNRISSCPCFWKNLQFGDSHMPVESWKMNGLATVGVGISYGLATVGVGISYGLATVGFGISYDYERVIRRTECKKTDEILTSGSKSTVQDNLETRSSCFSSNVIQVDGPPPKKLLEVVEKKDEDRLIGAIPKDYASLICAENHTDQLNVYNPCREFPYSSMEDNKYGTETKKLPEKTPTLVMKIGQTKELPEATPAPVPDKLKHVLPGQRHAFAGALSGTFVSLCLHPVDTIKTVIQSRCLDEKSIGHVVRSIISERGAFGLYRGIASNIAFSAPISAVYTYTYESVKGALLPLLAKDYHSIAHCTAGGCASIATSFIFTPSERIKQQMQVGSHYQNCWDALVGILQRGGLPSLYAGWGAVLCRNIPHSIIKFYTYESLKRRVLASKESHAPPSTFQTLVCGGIAGSTAAFFTTPFDVVKTRLQTQIPGSLRRYDGVFHALLEISKHEGLEGLYRGLTPRLIMYVSQGALFFVSYEFFKTIFFSEFPQLYIPSLHGKQNTEDEPTSLRATTS